MSVRLRVSTTASSHFTKFSLRVNCGHGSVLWRQCNMLCTSGFMDDVMFAHNRPGKVDASNAYTQSDSPGGRTGGEVWWFIGPTRAHNPTAASRSVQQLFAGLTTVTDRPTDRPRYCVCNSRPHTGRGHKYRKTIFWLNQSIFGWGIFIGVARSFRCEWIVGCHGDVTPLSAEDRGAMIKNVVQPMASDGLRTICIAYKDYVVGTPGQPPGTAPS